MSWKNSQAVNADQHADETDDDQLNGKANTIMNNIPPRSTNELSHEQLLAYYNDAVDFFYSNYIQPPKAYRQMIDSHLNLHPPLVSLPFVREKHGLTQQIQSMMVPTNVPLSIQRTMTIHSNTDRYKSTMITGPLLGSADRRPTSSMTNPTSTSTPAK